jgi:hypothetical protein
MVILMPNQSHIENQQIYPSWESPAILLNVKML